MLEFCYSSVQPTVAERRRRNDMTCTISWYRVVDSAFVGCARYRSDTYDDWRGAVSTRTATEGDGCRERCQLDWNVHHRAVLRISGGKYVKRCGFIGGSLIARVLYRLLSNRSVTAGVFAVVRPLWRLSDLLMICSAK